MKLADRSSPNPSSGAQSDPEPSSTAAPEPSSTTAPEASPAKDAARWRLPALALVLVLGIAGGMAAFDMFSTPASNPLAPLAVDDAKAGAVISLPGDTVSPRQPGDGAVRLAAGPESAAPVQEPAAQEPAATIPKFELNTARLAPPAVPKPARPAAAKSVELPGKPSTGKPSTEKPAAAAKVNLDNFVVIAAPPKISPPATVAPPKAVAAPKTVRTAKRPPAKMAAAGRTYTVQLASLKSRGAASREWSRLKTRFAGLLAGFEPVIERASVARRGVFYRLRAGAFASRKAARALRKAMRAKRQSCLVILR